MKVTCRPPPGRVMVPSADRGTPAPAVRSTAGRYREGRPGRRARPRAGRFARPVRGEPVEGQPTLVHENRSDGADLGGGDGDHRRRMSDGDRLGLSGRSRRGTEEPHTAATMSIPPRAAPASHRRPPPERRPLRFFLHGIFEPAVTSMEVLFPLGMLGTTGRRPDLFTRRLRRPLTVALPAVVSAIVSMWSRCLKTGVGRSPSSLTRRSGVRRRQCCGPMDGPGQSDRLCARDQW